MPILKAISALSDFKMKLYNAVLVSIFFLFSVISADVQAQHVPEYPNTALYVTIPVTTAISSSQKQCINYKRVIELVGGIAGVAAGTGIAIVVAGVAGAVGAGVGHGIEEAFIDENVEFPGRGAAIGAPVAIVLAGATTVVIIIYRCFR